MSIQTERLKRPEPLHIFDGELRQLHSRLLETSDLLIYQLEQAMHAFDFGDLELALKVIARDKKIDHLASQISAEMEAALFEHSPTGKDLNRVLSSDRIASELEKIGNTMVEFSRLTISLFEAQTGRAHANQALEILRMMGRLRIMLDKITVSLETQDSHPAYSLLAYGRQFDNDSRQMLRERLGEARQTEHNPLLLTLAQLLEVLNRCGGHCQKIAEYLIFMLDGKDFRHS